MMEESKWTSERRRSSSALQIKGLLEARPSFDAMLEMSILLDRIEIGGGNCKKKVGFLKRGGAEDDDES